MTFGKKSIMIATVLATVGAGAVGVGTTFAAEKITPKNHMESLVSAIATKFNLSTSDVQAVFDAEHADVMENMKEHALDRLEKAVADGKLTQAQSTAIQTKAASEKAFFESLKTMTKDQRQAAVKAERAALEQWAKDNNIPKEFMHFGGIEGPMNHGMMGRHGAMGRHMGQQK